MPPPTIRPEAPADADAIRDLTAAAFAGQPHGDGTEPGIPEALRRDGDLMLSSVAVEAERIVGHIAFSPVRIEGATGWLALGPLSVDPDRQRRGIGTALVRDGLSRTRAGGAAGCVLVGDPDYYRRFGFEGGTLTYADTPPRYVQGLAFDGPMPAGEVRFASAFGA